MYRELYEVIGYTYEADIHCLECTFARFPHLAADHKEIVFDGEGNEVRPISLGDEHDCAPCCGDCLQMLDS